jgi:putative Holliday junction resolvase
MSAVVGLDHGSRRIGIAVGSEETGQAFARPALHRRAAIADLDRIEALARAEGASTVVVGLPRNMDGSEGSQAAAARAFGAELSARGLAVVFVDERLTSWEAGERLSAEGRRPRRASGQKDSAAARLILQEYLDARVSPPAPQETA